MVMVIWYMKRYLWKGPVHFCQVFRTYPSRKRVVLFSLVIAAAFLILCEAGIISFNNVFNPTRIAIIDSWENLATTQTIKFIQNNAAQDSVERNDSLSQLCVGFKNNSGDNSCQDEPSADIPGYTDEVRHMAFLKVHKAGSSTIQNILYRFGISRNLTFVLPVGSHYLSKDKYYYKDILPLPNCTNQKTLKYDILCNHAVFNWKKFAEFMYTDAVYFAIVREPLDLLISAAYYYRYVYPTSYLTAINESNFISELISFPQRYEPEDLRKSRTFNYMTRDFGFELGSVASALNVTKKRYDIFLNHIASIFKLVLVMEKFDESLVLLKRYFKWTLKDVIYLKNNAFKLQISRTSVSDLSPSEVAAFRRSHWMDIKLYSFFEKRFEEQYGKENGIAEEVKAFQSCLNAVDTFCTETREPYSIVIPKSYWSDSFSVTLDDCKSLARNELQFFNQLLKRHRKMLENF